MDRYSLAGHCVWAGDAMEKNMFLRWVMIENSITIRWNPKPGSLSRPKGLVPIYTLNCNRHSAD